jgi:hypothetical protein
VPENRHRDCPSSALALLTFLSQICFLHTCHLLPLASFGSAPYSLDEMSVVKCVVKAGCSVSAGALTQIADQMSVDFPR